MSETDAPFIRLGEGARAPVLSYDVPQPSRYTGRNFVQLEFDDGVWSDEAKRRPDAEADDDRLVGGRPETETGSGGGPTIRPRPADRIIRDHRRRTTVPARRGVEVPPPRVGGGGGAGGGGGTDTAPISALSASTAAGGESLRSVLTDEERVRSLARDDPETLAAMVSAAGASATETTPADAGVPPASPLGRLMMRVGTDTVLSSIEEGWRLDEERLQSGRVELTLSPPPAETTPRLALVETYALSSFLGDYGAGRTVQTFSLLPGERTSISVKTFRSSESSKLAAASVLDSYEESVADEFGSDIQSENSVKKTDEENFSYHAEARAEAGWGWGSAEVSGGVAGGSASAREEFAKNVSSATRKHASRAASKRNVEVNTSTESSEKEGEETATTRIIENINVSRTLNFVFRQMNQEFVSLLHLVDARVAFHNGDPSTYREVTLPELDSLLDAVIVSERREEVRTAVVESLSHVYDYRGEHHSLVEERTVTGDDGEALLGDDDGEPQTYLRVRPVESVYEPNGITVEGVVLSATKTTLPTDGVVVEALLGQGNALDDYALGLQREEVRSRDLENDAREATAERDRLARRIVSEGDADDAERFERVFGALAREDGDADRVGERGRETEPAPTVGDGQDGADGADESVSEGPTP